MLYDYKKESKCNMILTLENGKMVKGEFIEVRIDSETLPKDKTWYNIRHSDEDWSDPASIKNGCVLVNFYGTFICDPIEDFANEKELGILKWLYTD